MIEEIIIGIIIFAIVVFVILKIPAPYWVKIIFIIVGIAIGVKECNDIFSDTEKTTTEVEATE